MAGESVDGGEGSKSSTGQPTVTADGHEAQKQDPSLCGARKRSDGNPCGNVKGYKTDHVGYGPCKYHGGATRSHKRKAALDVAGQMVVTYGLPIDVTPEQAIIGEIQRTAGAVAWLEEVVRSLAPEDLVWGRAEAKLATEVNDVEDLKTGDGHAHGDLYEVVMKAGANAWLTLYQKEREHLAKICISAIKAGLEERKVRLAERQGLQLAAVIKRFAVEIGLSQSQMLEAPAALRRALDSVMMGPKVIDVPSTPAARAVASVLDD